MGGRSLISASAPNSSTEHRLSTMSQRFTVSASSRSDGELGEINQLFEGDEPNPSSSDKEGASDLVEDPVKGRMWSVITHL